MREKDKYRHRLGFKKGRNKNREWVKNKMRGGEREKVRAWMERGIQDAVECKSRMGSKVRND